MIRFFLNRPIVDAFVFAAVLGGLLALMAPEGEAWIRGLLGAALALLSFDVTVAAYAARGPKRPGNPDRWVYVAAMAWYFAVFLWLFLAPRDGIEPEALFAPAIGGAIFGLIMGFWPGRDPEYALPDGRYRTARPVTATRAGRIAYYGWPILSALVVCGLVVLHRVWPMPWPVFAVVLTVLPFLVPLAPPGGSIWPPNLHLLPRFTGFVLAFAALVVS